LNAWLPCLPGAALTGRAQDGTYDATFSVKIRMFEDIAERLLVLC
jgi:hypothetical protein